MKPRLQLRPSWKLWVALGYGLASAIPTYASLSCILIALALLLSEAGLV